MDRNEIEAYVLRVARHFRDKLDASLVDVYKMGSLSHGGFSDVYSDLDVGVILDVSRPPPLMAEWIAQAKSLHPEYGKKLSIFWGDPAFEWGRLPVIDRLDLLDHAASLLNGHKLTFPRPSREAVHGALLESVDKSWRPRLPVLKALSSLPPEERKPFIRAILYPARLIYTWDNLAVDSNDRAVAYLAQTQPSGLDLKPIAAALACRLGECSAEDVFSAGVDFDRQYAATISYISR